jgi:quercetin dioxygenase-like cupin family protein
MNINALHHQEKAVSASALFSGEQGTTTTIRIKQGAVLKEHITPTPALLLCIQGHVVFENENGTTESLMAGDYVIIEPMVRHWLVAMLDSNVLLMK